MGLLIVEEGDLWTEIITTGWKKVIIEKLGQFALMLKFKGDALWKSLWLQCAGLELLMWGLAGENSACILPLNIKADLTGLSLAFFLP